MKSKYLAILFLGICVACSPEPIEEIVEETPSNQVQFSNLKVGQKSQYLRFEFDCVQTDTAFKWTGDTLNLEVVAKEGTLYFQETFTPNSANIENLGTEPILYPVEEEIGKLRIPERSQSQLFFFYGNDVIDLNYMLYSRPELKQNGCRLLMNETPFIGNDIAKVERFDVGGIHIKDKTVVSCVPVILGIDAYLMYDINQLYLSYTYNHSGFMEDEWILVGGYRLIETKN